jgi:uncharacterized protein
VSGGNWKELFKAACEGDLELLGYHVRSGVDVNYAHPEFLSTPLVACILARQEPAALYLLAHGADPALYSEFDGLTPAQAAQQTGLPEVLRRLRQLGIEPPAAVPAKASMSGWRWLLARGSTI